MQLNSSVKSLFSNSSFILRGISAGIKFVFVLYLASFESATIVGQYALLATTLAIAVQVTGLDVTTIVGRIIHKKDHVGKLKLLETQYGLYLLNYIIVFPLILVIFDSFISNDLFLAVLFGFIVIMEHFFTEIFRTLVSLVKVKSATAIQFLKSVPYVVFIIMYSIITKENVSIYLIVTSWLINLIFVFVFFLFKYNKVISLKLNVYFNNKSYFNIKSLILDSLPYFMITILGVLFSQVDKFIINDYLGHELLGVYFTFFTICSVLTLLISLTVGVNQGPLAIKAFSEYGLEKYLQVREQLIRSYFIYISLGFFITLILGLVYIAISNNVIYNDNFMSFIILLVSTSMLAMGHVFRIDLYLLEKDKVLLIIYISSLVFNISILLIMLPIYGVVGASLSSLISTFLMVTMKVFLSNKYIKLSVMGK